MSLMYPVKKFWISFEPATYEKLRKKAKTKGMTMTKLIRFILKTFRPEQSICQEIVSKERERCMMIITLWEYELINQLAANYGFARCGVFVRSLVGKYLQEERKEIQEK